MNREHIERTTHVEREGGSRVLPAPAEEKPTKGKAEMPSAEVVIEQEEKGNAEDA